MRGGNEAHIYAHASVAAYGAYFVFLNGAQQLGLCGRRKLSYFIKKNSTALRFFQKTAPCAHSTGKGPLHVAEQFAFQQGFRQSCAVYGEKGFVSESACPVNVLGQTALARARFTGDENGNARARHLAYGLQNLLHGRAVVNKGHRRFILVRTVQKLTVQTGVLGSPLHEGGKLRIVHGLGQVAVGSELHRFHGTFNGPHSGHHDERQTGIHDPHTAQDLKAAHPRHGKIAHHHVYTARGDPRQRPLPVQSRFGFPALAGKKQGKNFMPFGVVVHHQNLITAFSALAHIFTLKLFCGEQCNGNGESRKEAPLRETKHIFAPVCSSSHRILPDHRYMCSSFYHNYL